MAETAAPILGELEPETREKVLKLGNSRLFGTNELVFSEGDRAEFLPIVLSGRVKMVRYPEAGKEVIIGMFGPGEIFAIPPALDGKRFPATAVAAEESRLLLLPRQVFLDLMSSSETFSAMIMQRMCGLLRERTDTVQILATPSAEQRIANVLLKLAGEIGDNETKKITHRRQDIAEMAGLTLESTIRSIRKLADRGYFRIIQGKIHLDSTRSLRNFVRS
ncbi:MAG: Crp/Fnr family transcriptional regulator [Pyrinomonadaceae bacterium]